MKKRKREEEEEEEEHVMMKHTKSLEHWKLFFCNLHMMHCPKLKAITVFTTFGVYSYSLQYIKLICILLYKIHIYFCQMERHTFAFALSMKIFKTTRGVLRGK